MERVLVTGAGGFIGHHLVTYLKSRGFWVRGVDVEPPYYTEINSDEFEIRDLRRWDACLQATRDVDHVYALAADMGGIEYVSTHSARILHNNSLINLHTLEAARLNGVSKYLYASSASVYPKQRQIASDLRPLNEEDAYPADPQDAYGWEKLVSEQLATHYAEDHGLATRIVRLHNIYGPYGTYEGGREKAPAALCRKVAQAEDGDIVEIWGDGRQTRSFCYIDDCIEGIYRLMVSDYGQPLNLGSDEVVTLNQLAQTIIELSGKRNLSLKHVPGSQGVRGRNSDNSRIRKVLGWEPTTNLENGLAPTYRWIEKRISG